MKTIIRAIFGISLLNPGLALAEEDFKPSGSFNFTQTFYGNAGGYKTATARPNPSLSYNFAPKWSIDLNWDRTWGMFDYTDKNDQQYEYLSEPSATLTYSYGKLGESKVDWTSSLMIENQSTMNDIDNNYIYAQTTFDFAEYLPKSDFLQATQFALAPQYVYGWNSKGGAGHVNTAGLALLTNWTLPANFSFTFNSYAFKDWYNGSFAISGENETYTNATYFVALAWLQYEKTLRKFNENTSLDFNFIGGLDPYMASNRNASWEPFLASNSMYEWLGPTVQSGNYRSTYNFFVLPGLTLNYQLNDKVSFNVFAQLKYSNQIWGDKERSWRFQPQGGFGLTYNF